MRWRCQCELLFQEEEALLSEMEVTGQAFEDMQEQNIRLLQQLREKDDANFKLMSEVSFFNFFCTLSAIAIMFCLAVTYRIIKHKTSLLTCIVVK